jgi:uncharacterized membrane-anchored protein YhcB (DUF1043 family)
MGWLFYLIVFAAGGFGGYVLAKSRNPDTRVRELEEHLTSLQSKYEHYQENVTQHFVSTAQLVNALSNNYREVHEHLRRGAETLCADNRRHGSNNPANAFERLDSTREKTLPGTLGDDHYALQPPRDYATKKPTEKGTLDEDFGFRD